ncbi:MAG: nitrate/nitrite transporter [Flavobacteriales bacterium]
MPQKKGSIYSNYRSLIVLILAGEVIFFLPFVLPRIFKPTLLEVFQISNTDLGLCFSVYGLVAILAYVFGGPIADKYQPKWLLSIALFLTGCGGLVLISYPSLFVLKLIYGYWGITTIFLFWASLMKSTRIVGGDQSQGTAFGVLDGGRGLVAALIATLGVSILAYMLPIQLEQVTLEEKKDAFLLVILTFTFSCFIMAAVVFFGLQKLNEGEPLLRKRLSFKVFKEQLMKKEIVLQAIIILCAYSGYRVTDDFSLLAKDLLNYSDVEAANMGTLALWLRPPIAIIAGVLADKWKASRMISVSFIFMLASGLTMGLAPSEFYSTAFITMIIASTCAGVYALRGLYFAIMQEARVPALVTGSAVGVASMIGYLPDIYMAPFMGVFLDAHAGLARGHQLIFLVMAGFALVGLVVSQVFYKTCVAIRNQIS